MKIALRKTLTDVVAVVLVAAGLTIWGDGGRTAWLGAFLIVAAINLQIQFRRPL